MKLQTSIPPRRDGTVRVLLDNGETVVFANDGTDELVAEVTCEASIARLLAGKQFFPVDPADFDVALKLAKSLEPKKQVDEDDDEPIDASAPPIEAYTPPARTIRRAKKANE